MRLRCSVNYMILATPLKTNGGSQTYDVIGASGTCNIVSGIIKVVFIAGELYDIVDTLVNPYYISIKTPLHDKLINLNSYEVENYFHTEQETRDSLIKVVLN